MKRKTDFKQMFLVDTVLFNKVSNAMSSNDNRVWVNNNMNESRIHQREENNRPATNPKVDLSTQTDVKSIFDAATETYKVEKENKRTSTEGLRPIKDDTDEDCMECDQQYPIVASSPQYLTAQFPPQFQTPAPTRKAIDFQSPLIQQQQIQYQQPTSMVIDHPISQFIQPSHQPTPQQSTPIYAQPMTPLPLPSPQTARAASPEKQVSIRNQSEIVEPGRNVLEYSKFICTLCGTSYKRKEGLQRHMTNMHDAYQQKDKGVKRKKTFTCDVCNNEFNSKKALNRHIKNIHGAFSQVEKGIKRKNQEQNLSVSKYVKFV